LTPQYIRHISEQDADVGQRATVRYSGEIHYSPVDLQNPTTHFYSFSAQRLLSKDTTFEIGYSGCRSYHQLRQGQTNPGILSAEEAAAVVASGKSSPRSSQSTL
jgi:hypothetical protein